MSTMTSIRTRRRAAHFFVIGTLLVLVGCSSLPGETLSKDFSSVRPAPGPREMVELVFAGPPTATEPDVSRWKLLTSTPAVALNLASNPMYCELRVPESVPAGAWHFTGVTETYTPILDIVADRTGLPVSGSRTYYHFRLRSQDR